MSPSSAFQQNGGGGGGPEHLIDLTSYELDGDIPQSSPRMSSPISSQTSSLGNGNTAMQQQQQSIVAASAAASPKSASSATTSTSINIPDKEQPRIGSGEATMVSDGAVRGPPPPAHRLLQQQQHMNGGGGGSSDFPSSLAIRMRDSAAGGGNHHHYQRRLDAVDEETPIIRLEDTILDPEEEKRRERMREKMGRSPEPIPATPSLETDYFSSYNTRHKRGDNSNNNNNPMDTDLLSEAAVRSVRTPEPIPATPSLESEGYRHRQLQYQHGNGSGQRDHRYGSSGGDGGDHVPHYVDTSQPMNSPSRSASGGMNHQHHRDMIDRASSLIQAKYPGGGGGGSQPVIAATPSLETEMPKYNGGDPTRPQWSRVSVTKLGNENGGGAISSSQHQQHPAGIGQSFDSAYSLPQDVSNADSFGGNSTGGNSGGKSSMYRRAILARKRKTAARGINGNGHAFKPVQSQSTDDGSQGESHRQTIKDKYRNLFISPGRSSMDIEDGPSFRFDDESSLRGVILETVREVNASSPYDLEKRELGETRQRSGTSEDRDAPSPEHPRIVTKSSGASKYTRKSSSPRKLRIVEQPGIPQVMSDPHHGYGYARNRDEDAEGDGIPGLPKVLSEPRKKSRVPQSIRDTVADAMSEVAKISSYDSDQEIQSKKKSSPRSSPRAKDKPNRRGKGRDSNAKTSTSPIVNSEEAFVHMRKNKPKLRLDLKEFNSVVSADGEDMQNDDTTMQMSVMKLLNNDDDDEDDRGEVEVVPKGKGYSKDLCISDDSSSSEDSQGKPKEKKVSPENDSKKTNGKKKKSVGFTDLPPRPEGTSKPARLSTAGDESQDEGATSGEDSQFASGDERGGDVSEDAESDSKISIVDSESTDSGELDPGLDPHVLYDSEAAHFVLQMLDRSCAWLEDDGWGCNGPPSLLREIKKKSRYEANVTQKTSDRRKSRGSSSKKSRIIGKAPSLFRKTKETPVVQEFDNTSRVQDLLSSDTDANDTDDQEPRPVSPFARPRLKRSTSPRKKKDSPKNSSESPSRRRQRSKSPRKRSNSNSNMNPLDLVPSSPQPQAQDHDSPFQKKLQEKVGKPEVVDVTGLDTPPDTSDEQNDASEDNKKEKAAPVTRPKSPRRESQGKLSSPETRSSSRQRSTQGLSIDPPESRNEESPTRARSPESIRSNSTSRREPPEIHSRGKKKPDASPRGDYGNNNRQPQKKLSLEPSPRHDNNVDFSDGGSVISNTSSRRAFGGPEAHVSSRRRQQGSKKTHQPLTLPDSSSMLSGVSGHFMNRLETIQEHGSGEMMHTDQSSVLSMDPFAGLTEEERYAALELAEKLRRRAVTLKRRRRARENRNKQVSFLEDEEEEEEDMSYSSMHTSSHQSFSGDSYGYSIGMRA